jgi:hypothetical protein
LFRAQPCADEIFADGQDRLHPPGIDRGAGLT